MNPLIIEALPPLSPLAPSLLQLDWEADDAIPRLLQVLNGEPTLGARLIGMANAAVHGAANHRFASIENALQRVGLRRTIQLCTAMLLGQAMHRRISSSLGHALWLHALTMAQAAEEIARLKSMQDPHAAYFPGLVHDIGYMAMEYLQPNSLAQVVSLATRENINPEQAEERLLDTNHTALATHLLEHWRLPEYLIAPVRHHHDLDLDTNSIAAVVFGAEKIARCSDVVDYLYVGLEHPFTPLTIDRLGVSFHFNQQLELTEEELDQLIGRIVDKVDTLRDQAKILSPTQA